MKNVKEFQVIQLSGYSFFELDILLLNNWAYFWNNTVHTLNSLVNLVNDISNIVILKKVQKMVFNSKIYINR